MLRRLAQSVAGLLLLASAVAVAADLPVDTTQVLEVQDGWEYGPAAGGLPAIRAPSIEHLPEAWEQVALPHVRGPEPCGFYRVSFAVPAAWSACRITLALRPLGGAVAAWLNGQPLGARADTALDARLDASRAVRPGVPNLLLVAVSAPGNLDRGGLAACWLEATGTVTVDGLDASACRMAQGAVLDVRLGVANRSADRFEGKVEVALEPDAEGKDNHPIWRWGNDIRVEPGTAASVAHSFEVEPPRFWRFDDPFLYRLTTTIRTREGRLVHTAVRRLGLKSVDVGSGRWRAAGEWVRLAGVVLAARGATLFCTQPGQASAASARLAAGGALDELLGFCDERGIVVFLDAPAGSEASTGWREAIDALAAEAALHPCVWGWVAIGQPEAYPTTLARLREAAPGIPVGRPLPDAAEDAKDFDFVVDRFATRAARPDDDGYGRRLDDLCRDAAGKAIVAIDRMAADPADRAALDASLARRSGEADRRWPLALLGFALDRDEGLFRAAEARLCPFSLKPPNHEVRLDKETFVLKSRFEVAVMSPVAGRLPCHSLSGYRLAWMTTRDGAQVASGTIALPTIQTRSLEGGPTGPGRGETEWRLVGGASQPRVDLDFAVELQSAAGCVVASHRASLSLQAAGGKAELRVGPPKAEAPAPAPPKPIIPPETVAMLELTQLFNNDAISSDKSKQDGNFDLPERPSGDTYPAEQLPESGADLAIAAVPGLAFRFPDKADGKPNNARCQGQRVLLPPGVYSGLWLLASADTADQEGAATIEYEKGREPVTLRVSDWCGEAKFGEIEAVRCTARHTFDGTREEKVCRMWAIPLPLRREPLKAVLLPKSDRIHLFAATLIRATETECVHADALANSFDNDGISWKANPRDGNFNLMARGVGHSFIADLLPKAGALVPVPGAEDVTFRFPSKDDRARNNVLCDGQRISFARPFASFDAVWFLGACHDGARSALLDIEYEDGAARGELRLADWASKPAAGEIDVLRMPSRHTLEGKEEAIECGLVAWRVPLDPNRKLVAITLPRERRMHVFAVTFTRTRVVETKNP